ncbi:unnamed protein product [Schistocephalus solidus]|uniref:Uncharacterized protein n=1 Tax=Schistocephalus solidus TaxID=70667 RepID=A0A183SEC1_SCHSO|nr:unnamed protein product [Schistocephalus solidus]
MLAPVGGNAPVAASSWYPTLTCGSLKLVLPSGHSPGNHHDQRAKPGEGLRCSVHPHTRYVCSRPLHFTFSRPPCLSPPTSLLLPLLYPLFTPSSPIISLTLTSLFPSSALPLPSPFPPPNGRKSPTTRATCINVGGPGESVVLSPNQLVIHSRVR